MNTTLLLDFDGVINSEPFLRKQRNHGASLLFDPSNMQCLNALIERAGIKSVVITSSWRVGRTIEDLRQILSNEGFAHSSRICDVTRDLNKIGADGRAEEIRDWIRRTSPGRVIILDDYDLEGVVEEGFFRVHSYSGLTTDLVNQIVQFTAAV